MKKLISWMKWFICHMHHHNSTVHLYIQYLLFHFGQSDLLIPLVLFSIFKWLAETWDGLLEFPLLSVDPLYISWSKLLVLQEVLQFISLMFQGLQMTDCRKTEGGKKTCICMKSDPISSSDWKEIIKPTCERSSFTHPGNHVQLWNWILFNYY